MNDNSLTYSIRADPYNCKKEIKEYAAKRPKSYLSAFFIQNFPVFGAKNVHLQFHLKKSQITFYFSKENTIRLILGEINHIYKHSFCNEHFLQLAKTIH